MGNIIQIIGFIGTFLIAAAYAPQIFHMIKTKCVMGVDLKAWMIWFVAYLMVLVYAISTKEIVFITLMSLNLLSTSVICTLKIKYGGSMCKHHTLKLGKSK